MYASILQAVQIPVKIQSTFCMRLLSLTSVIVLFFFISCSKTKNKIIAAPGQTFINIQYGTAPDTAGKEEKLIMDIDLPKDVSDSKKYPLMLMIHGGGFMDGDKKEMASHCSVLADSGYVGVTINYRLGWQRGTNKCDGNISSEYDALYRAVQDANAAMRFLAAHADAYHIDTSRLYIGGGSAGGTIALYTTYFNSDVAMQMLPEQYKKFGALNISGNAYTHTFTIKGVLNLWGGMGDSLLINSRNALPMITFHGTADHLSPYDTGHEYSCDAFPKAYGSACLSRQVAAANVPYQCYLKKGAAHAPAAFTASVVMPLAVQFFNALHNHLPTENKVITE